MSSDGCRCLHFGVVVLGQEVVVEESNIDVTMR